MTRTADLYRRSWVGRVLCLLVICHLPALAARGQSVVLEDGDRVVLLGATFVERMQSYGYLETLLTIAQPAKQIQFRNLGWSGDTVFGDARALFGEPADGFARLEADLLAARPTVVLVSYGANEAHAGPAGLARYRTGLRNLLAALQETGARLVFLAPRRYERPSPSLPDVAPYNASLREYAAVSEEEVVRAGGRLVDGYQLGQDGLAANGVHLGEYGYWSLAFELAAVWDVTLPAWEVTLNAESLSARSAGTRVTGLTRAGNGLRWECLDDRLPYPALPSGSPPGARAERALSRLGVLGLEPGEYALRIDGRPQVQATARDWQQTIPLASRGGAEQTAALIQAIREKNQLFFHRHRPQNETYLFLFRRHEQGNNAVEIPQFDPLIERQEEQIAALKQPRQHVYELVRIEP